MARSSLALSFLLFLLLAAPRADGRIHRVAEDGAQVEAPAVAGAVGGRLPNLPLQFSANITVVAHLVDRTMEYPPWRRRLRVHYDYVNKRAATFVLEGFEANKTFLRRWDTKQEYVWKHGPFAQCRRAYLSEPMPLPSLPSATSVLLPGSYSLSGRACRMWVHRDDGPSRQKILVDIETGLPLSVTDEFYEAAEVERGEEAREDRDGDDSLLDESSGLPPKEGEEERRSTAAAAGKKKKQGKWVPVMTYTFEEIATGQPPHREESGETGESGIAAEEAPGKAGTTTTTTRAASGSGVFNISPPWEHATCSRHVGGWPYIHAFHHFLKL